MAESQSRSKTDAAPDFALVSVRPKACRIEGHWGRLRPLVPSTDASPIFALSHDDARDVTWREMKVGPFADETAFANHVTELANDEKRAFFAVTDLTDRPLGWMCLMEARLPHNVVEIGYVLYPPILQRTALATEAFYLLMRHVFEDLHFRRLEWTCTASNQRSRVAAARLGFMYEGTHRQGLFLKGKPTDICMYSMLASEWPGNAHPLQAWLDPRNFAEGKRLRSLAEFRV